MNNKSIRDYINLIENARQSVSESTEQSFAKTVHNLLSKAGYQVKHTSNGFAWTNGEKVIEIELDPADPDTIYWALGVPRRNAEVNWVESGSDEARDALGVIKNFARHPLPESAAEEQLEETTPESIEKVEQLARK